MTLRLYIKNVTSDDRSAPVELEVDPDDRVEDLVEGGVSWFGLGDRGDYLLVKDGKALDDTQRITRTNIQPEDTLLLVNKSEHDDVEDIVKNWIRDEIGIPKEELQITDKEMLDNGEQKYLLRDLDGHNFEITTFEDKVKKYKPVKND